MPRRGPVKTSPAVGVKARPLDPDINPWERQPGESERAWKAFSEFRESDERSTANDYSLKNWSSTWSWGYRVFEYDRYLDRKDIEEAVRYRRKMNDRQRRAATLAQQKVIQWLVNLDPSTLTASDAVRWLEAAVKIERLAGGDPTERIAVAGVGPIDKMGAEEVSNALAGIQVEINRVLSQVPVEPS